MCSSAWEREHRPPDVPLQATVAITTVTASELLHGVHRANTAQRRHRRQVWVEAVIAGLTIVPVDLSVARVHARVWADLMAAGTLIGAHDLLIGSTALAHDMVVATRNEEEFRRIRRRLGGCSLVRLELTGVRTMRVRIRRIQVFSGRQAKRASRCGTRGTRCRRY